MIDLWTIGYSAFTIRGFTGVIKDYGIPLIIDVRSTPYSRYHPDYNKEALEKTLSKHSVFYRNYATEFGGHQTERAFFAPEGYLDFEKFAKSADFIRGLSRLANSLEQGYTFALMCAEKAPSVCHRSIMVARSFHELGLPVKHILPGGGTKTHGELETELLDCYFPNRDQLPIDGVYEDDETLIRKAYRLRNSEIGYRLYTY